MAKRIVSHSSITPTATADTADLVDSTYPFALQGASATQTTNILEVQVGGQAGASSPTFMLLARDSQIATGSLTADAQMNDAPLHPATAALAAPVVVFNKAATLKPRRDVAKHLLNLGLNVFGGIVRWVAAPGEEITMVGNTASFGETSFSAFTGGTAGLLGTHMIYETL